MSSPARGTADKASDARPKKVGRSKRISKRVVQKADGRYLIYYQKT